MPFGSVKIELVSTKLLQITFKEISLLLCCSFVSSFNFAVIKEISL